jgi:peptidyl-dipeptidase Dcp
VKKIEKSRHFNQGFATLEYLAASLLDMDWHTLTEAKEVDTAAFEQRSLKRMGMIPEIVVRYRSPYFAHIFSGGYYAAGYYSYIWSAVLDADAYEAFKKAGIYDKKTARAFRQHVLARAGAEEAMKLYVRFRGAKPGIEPLLKRRGLK